MVIGGSLQFSHDVGFCKNQPFFCNSNRQFQGILLRDKLPLLSSTLKFRQHDSWRSRLSESLNRPTPYRRNAFRCHSFLVPRQAFDLPAVKAASLALSRSYNVLQGSPLIVKLAPAVGVIIFALCGLGPLMRQSRNLLLHKSDNSWKKSGTYYVMTSYIQPLLLWTGATLICRALDPLVLSTEASQVVKMRLLNFVQSLSTVLAFAYCLSRMIQQAQKFFMESTEPSDARNMGFQFAGKAVYSAVWVAAVSLFMELLGFSTQRWLTAGGLGTVLLTLAGREIFTNFLSSAMIHATRPFVVNEWIQTKIEGYEVSGTVEHVGWWSPTIVRGEDREAVHIPNHKFTVNVVRNLTQKTHWRIKTHLAISHLDAHKINNIVADMRKVLAKNPQVEQQRLHRRVFLDNVNPENQALLILVSCFVKTSHHEEYLCVKEAILLDLLRVISHHRARLATPIRTMQKIYTDADLENIPFTDSGYNRGGVPSNRSLLLIEPSYRINGEEKAKSQSRSGRVAGEQDSKTAPRSTNDNKAGTNPKSDSKVIEMPKSDMMADANSGEMLNFDSKEHTKQTSSPDSGVGAKSQSPSGCIAGEQDGKMMPCSTSNNKAGTNPKSDSKVIEMPKSDMKADVNSGEMQNFGSKEHTKQATSPPASRVVDKTLAKPSPTSVHKTNSNAPETSSLGPKAVGSVSDNLTQNTTTSDTSQIKTTGPVNARQNHKLDNFAVDLSDAGNDKAGGLKETSLSKQEKKSVPKPLSSRPALEENIVLGVALEGSKRTLPIEEEMASHPTPEEKKQMAAASQNGTGSLAVKKDRGEGPTPSPPSATSGDQ